MTTAGDDGDDDRDAAVDDDHGAAVDADRGGAAVEDLGGTAADAPIPVVALDASALMAPIEADIRLFDELDRLLGGYEAVVPAAVVAELDSLRESGGEEGTAASVGADLASRARTVETDESYADDGLVELAAAGSVDYVVTNDRPLRDRLLERDVPVIGLRGRNALAITEP